MYNSRNTFFGMLKITLTKRLFSKEIWQHSLEHLCCIYITCTYYTKLNRHNSTEIKQKNTIGSSNFAPIITFYLALQNQGRVFKPFFVSIAKHGSCSSEMF